MSALWESPFFGVTLTILAYWAGCKIQKRTGLVICNGLVLGGDDDYRGAGGV